MAGSPGDITPYGQFERDVVVVGGCGHVGLPLAIAATAVIGMLLEVCVLRRLYARDHMAQVLATFAIILIANDLVRMIWGPQPLALNPPAALAGPASSATAVTVAPVAPAATLGP